MLSLQSTSFWAALLVCIPCGIILALGSKTKSNIGTAIFGGTTTCISVCTTLLVLYFYSFGDSPRIAIWVAFFLMAALLGVYFGFSSRYFGLYTLALLAFSLALGFMIAVYLAQIIGLAAIILKELFWIVAFLLVCASGGSSIPIVRVYIV